MSSYKIDHIFRDDKLHGCFVCDIGPFSFLEEVGRANGTLKKQVIFYIALRSPNHH